MGKVIDLHTVALRKKKMREEAQELDALKANFLDLISGMNQVEVIELIDAIKNHDQAKYLELTTPVIIRKAIRLVNRNSRHD